MLGSEEGFHSINVPSEWELDIPADVLLKAIRAVSIQLMSPASGNRIHRLLQRAVPFREVSIQLMSPASGNKTDVFGLSP